MRLRISENCPPEGELSVSLYQARDGSISMMVREPNEDRWSIFKINTDGTGHLFKWIESSNLVVSKSSQIKLVSE